ncbi:ribonuclease D [Neokomagataea thailandica NBRC 106555]|uniref:Ribonuclease D n=2 Tax=Neokomagataea TaxID=1223423 RepID=A0A4Y6V945_9PROT|nr:MULTISPECIES: ribonuclease D [Neokomagataea]QDH25180.1 ribonuclease D [Neokomagataea tanensis]GBR51908.1 ribonuclease D [Neokomagataea thailandica NBRC 106555]
MCAKKFEFPDPVLLTTTEEVARICAKLKLEPYVTIDTEFVREKTYWPELCLVQLSGTEDVVLIDTLAPGLDLSPLSDLLAAPDCIKVFHAARQDLEIFLHLFDQLPRSIFDTQVAAMVAGFGDQVGYDSLVGAITGRTIDKAHRFSDWSARPLTPAQIAYAAADVTYLRVVYESLHQQLKEQGRLRWADAEQAILTEETTFRPDPRRLWEKLKARTSNRRMLGVLREIAAWREGAAQEADIPRQRIIRDESLLEIAAIRPTDTDGLSRVRGVTRGFAEGRMGAGLLAAIRAGLDLPEGALPKAPSKSDKARPSAALVAMLRVLLAAKCEEHGVAPKLVASADDLDRIALAERDVSALKGWRKELFGLDALALVRGEIALAVVDGQVMIKPMAGEIFSDVASGQDVAE